MRVTITIPESLSELTVYQYQKYLKLIEGEGDNMDFVNQKAVESFCNVRINDIRAIKASDYASILTDIGDLFSNDTPLVRFFKLGGQEFGFIPNLENITLGEHIDLETYLSDIEMFHRAMAVMFRPVTYRKKDKYLIEDYETADTYAELMKSAPLDALLGAQVFFYNLGKDLVRSTMLSSEGLTPELMTHLEQNGVGTAAFMHWLGEGWTGSMTSLN